MLRCLLFLSSIWSVSLPNVLSARNGSAPFQNVPPVIESQNPVSTAEDNAVTVEFEDVVVTDPDNTYPENFVMTLSGGSNYEVSDRTVTPAENFFGTLTVPVTVNDGTSESAPFDLVVTVEAVNDAPVITDQSSLSISEGQSLEILLSDISITDPDNTYPDDFSLMVNPGENYTVSGTSITPSPDFSGSLSVPVSVSDGSASSNNFPLTVNVTTVNDVPVITGQSPVNVAEDQSVALTLDYLTVTDSDNVYPNDFSLTVNAGDNYAVSGTTVTPAPNFNGTLTVPVSVNDGTSSSENFSFSIAVTPVNDVPSITGQSSISVAEDQSVTIETSSLTVTDPDNTYPDGFSIAIGPGTNYTVSGTTITPSENFNGSLTVPVTVNDGSATSESFSLAVSVSPVNDAPVITDQDPISIGEEQAFNITLAQLSVTDPDNTYPTGFSLTVKTGSNYSVSGTTITPSPNFAGTLSVPVSVNDGAASSPDFLFSISVSAAADPPVITGQNPVSTPEEQAVTITLDQLTVSDPDNTAEDLMLIVSEGSNYTLSGNTVTPVSNYNGVLTVPVQVSDGTNVSEVFNMQVTVTPVNDPPQITGQTNAISLSENESHEITFDELQVSDPDNTYPSGFSLVVGNGDNYTVAGTTVTPTSGFSGTLSVPVTVSDGQANSNTFTVSISVSSVNDVPVITGQVPLQTTEETAITIEPSHLTVTDADNTYPNGFTLNVMSGENYTVSGSTVTPAAQFSGTLSVPVTVNDGTSTSAAFNVQITVTPVNDAPVITGQTPLSIAEDQPFVFELSYLVVTDPDNTYPDNFSLTISPGTNYTVNGSTITPQQNFTGTLTVPVTVSDGMSTSNTFNAQITVTASNDAPVITAQKTVQVNEDESITILLTHLEVSDPDNPTLEGITVSVQAGTNYTVSGNTVTPAKNFFGTLTVPVTVSDGTSVSNPFPLQVQVLPVNDKPVITGQVALSTLKNKELQLSLNHLTVTDVDDTYPGDFTLTVYPGANYSNFGTTVLPVSDYVGVLNVSVSVNDGTTESDRFNVQVTVVRPPNVAPVIQSQVKLTTYENQPLTVQLSHLIVNDPDNVFPTDFTLSVQAGANYTLNGNTVIPATNYSGMLTVPVTVKDKETSSPVFDLKIEVLPVADIPLITSQNFLSVNEDDSLLLTFEDLVVIDPDDDYPTGFTMTIQPGVNYTVSGMQIIPSKDFSGYLAVPVMVNDGENNSAPYQLSILVEPVNDPPVITDSENGMQYFGLSNGPLPIFDSTEIVDVDSDSLMYGEVRIVENFQAGFDSLIFDNTGSITAAFDRSEGVLLFFGKGSVEDYQNFVRGISYLYDGIEKPAVSTKTITLSVNDGLAASSVVTVGITFDAPTLPIDVPSGFTPNGDGVNDTWSIQLPEGNQTFESAVVRVYNSRGVVIFENKGFSKEWDGTANGTLLPADTYFYTIDLHSRNFRNQYKGIVTLLR